MLHTQIYSNICIYTHIYIYIYVFIYIRVIIYIRLDIPIEGNVKNAYVNTQTNYINIYIYKHIYIYTNKRLIPARTLRDIYEYRKAQTRHIYIVIYKVLCFDVSQGRKHVIYIYIYASNMLNI